MKLLLYCIKAKPYLYDDRITQGGYNAWYVKNNFQDSVNGKILAECDFSIEAITDDRLARAISDELFFIERDHLLKDSCLNGEEVKKYLNFYNWKFEKQDKIVGYAINLKNLHTFDAPKNLNEYMNGKFEEWDYRDLYELEKAPKNMQYVSTWGSDEISMWGSTYILVSVKPDNLCRILNGDKTIEIKKKVLKGMCK